jgi:hypothetical protein
MRPRRLTPASLGAGYAKSKDAPKEALGKYLGLGKAQGRPSLLQGDEGALVTDVTVRHDRGRDGLTPAGLINLARNVKPGLAPKQAANLVVCPEQLGLTFGWLPPAAKAAPTSPIPLPPVRATGRVLPASPCSMFTG